MTCNQNTYRILQINLKKKLGKRLEKALHKKEGIHVLNMYLLTTWLMKSCLASLLIKEGQIKAMMRNIYTTIRMSKIERIPKDLEHLELSSLSYRSVNWYKILENCSIH